MRDSGIRMPSIQDYMESVRIDLMKEKRIQKINELNGIVDEENIKKIKQYEEWIDKLGDGFYPI